MQWEYLQVHVFGEWWGDSKGNKNKLQWTVAFQVRGIEFAWYDYAAVLNDLGKDGWELVGTLGDRGTTTDLLFKRPVRAPSGPMP